MIERGFFKKKKRTKEQKKWGNKKFTFLSYKRKNFKLNWFSILSRDTVKTSLLDDLFTHSFITLYKRNNLL